MKAELYKEKCTKFSVVDIFSVIVEWYTGDITTEVVIANDGVNYYFDSKNNGSWYAPHIFCKLLT